MKLRRDTTRSWDGTSGDELCRGPSCQTHLFFGFQKDDVRQRGFDSIANTAVAVRVGKLVGT